VSVTATLILAVGSLGMRPVHGHRGLLVGAAVICAAVVLAMPASSARRDAGAGQDVDPREIEPLLAE
jgi:hypothetical protein